MPARDSSPRAAPLPPTVGRSPAPTLVMPRTSSSPLISPDRSSGPAHLATTGCIHWSSAEDADNPAVTVDPHPLAGLDPRGRVPGADDGRHPVLAGYDRGVRHRAADVGHRCLDLAEHRRPARRGDRADQDLTVADLAYVIDAAQDPGGSLDHPRRRSIAVDLGAVAGCRPGRL